MSKDTAASMECSAWELKAPVKEQLTWSSRHEERPSFGWDTQFLSPC